jgi:hypothetical protein
MVDTSSSSVYHDPDAPKITAPRLGVPGTPSFFASLLKYISTTASDFPLDPVIFQSVILCVMVGNKHLLLRTREEDIYLVQNLAALVSGLSSISPASSARCVTSSGPLFRPRFTPLSPSLLAYDMGSSCIPDFLRHTRLHNPQTQDSITVGYLAANFRFVNLLFTPSRSSDGSTGLPLQDALETLTPPSHLRRSQPRG